MDTSSTQRHNDEIIRSIQRKDRKNVDDAHSHDSAYETMSLSSFSDTTSQDESDDSALCPDARKFLQYGGDGNKVILIEASEIHGQYDEILSEKGTKQTICAKLPIIGNHEKHVHFEAATVLLDKDCKTFSQRPITCEIFQSEAEGWSSYCATKFCVPKLRCSTASTQRYSINNARPFFTPNGILSPTVEIDCGPSICKSTSSSVLSMRTLQTECVPVNQNKTSNPRPQVNRSMEIDALISTANVHSSKNVGTNAQLHPAPPCEAIPECFEQQMADMNIKRPIEQETINFQNILAATGQELVTEIRRAGASEITNVNTAGEEFQRMLSSEMFSMDSGMAVDQKESDALDYRNISKKDILIIHSEDDLQSAVKFREDIEQICRRNNLTPDATVDLQEHIDAGKQNMGCLDSLHDRYRFILVFVTNAFQADSYKQFHSECVIVFGLDSGGDKLHRVVPVWVDVTRKTCTIPYLKTLNGITYKGNMSTFFEQHMCKTVKHFREMIQ